MRSYIIPFLLCFLVCINLIGCGDSDDETNEDTIKVFKYDESVQCGDDGIPLNDMEQELINAGIPVICSQKNNDGLVRAAVCGNSTGTINVYLINIDDLSYAQELEFESVEELPDYVDQSCE